MRHGLFCRQYRNSVWRFESSPLGGAEKIHYFCTCSPAAQKKSIIFVHATLRRRKNPLFLYMQPCGAEKIHYFGTCNPAAQKKSIILGHATLRRRKNPLFCDMQPCGAENGHRFLTSNPAAQKILRRYCQTTLRRRKSRGATASDARVCKKEEHFCHRNTPPENKSKKIIFKSNVMRRNRTAR